MPRGLPRACGALADIFPQLDGVAIEHSWYGNVAMNRDMVPRIFARDGRRYAAGYCGSGVVWAVAAAQQAAGLEGVFVVEVVFAPAGVVRVGAEHVGGEQGGGFAGGEPVVELRDVGQIVVSLGGENVSGRFSCTY